MWRGGAGSGVFVVVEGGTQLGHHHGFQLRWGNDGDAGAVAEYLGYEIGGDAQAVSEI